MRERNIIICGGGTGGHLYAALSVGQKLQEKAPHVRLTYVGSSRAVEKNIMEHQDANFIPLKIEGIKGKGLKSILSLFLLPIAFTKSLSVLLSQRPSLVLGVGGYSSGPIVLLASLLRIPTVILEQNLYPGLTNKLLIPWVKMVIVSFENSLSYFKRKGIFIGNPVREEFYALSPKKRNGKLTLLIFGGSQGSHFLNQGVIDSLPLLKKEKKNLKIFHQTGKNDFEWVKKGYDENNFKEAVVSSFFFNMADYFKKSDLIISRAGATTVAELIASQRASLLVPFSKASDNHQVLNARELEKVKGAEVLLEEKFSSEIFAGKISFYLNNQEKITYMEKNLASMKKDKVAEKIAALCLVLMKNNP